MVVEVMVHHMKLMAEQHRASHLKLMAEERRVEPMKLMAEGRREDCLVLMVEERSRMAEHSKLMAEENKEECLKLMMAEDHRAEHMKLRVDFLFLTSVLHLCFPSSLAQPEKRKQVIQKSSIINWKSAITLFFISRGKLCLKGSSSVLSPVYLFVQ